MNATNKPFLMNQYAGDSIPMQTALHYAPHASQITTTCDGSGDAGLDASDNVSGNVSGHGNVESDAGIVLKERSVTGQLTIRLRGDLVAASNVILSVCGVELPVRLSYLGVPLDENLNTIAWMSPDEWRLCCPVSRAFEFEQALVSELSFVSGLSSAVVNNSGGFTVIDLSGRDAEILLKKSTGYDVRARNFPVGKVVNTTFAKASITLLKTGNGQWQLWARRSFSDYIGLWLQHSARDCGLNI